MVELDL